MYLLNAEPCRPAFLSERSTDAVLTASFSCFILHLICRNSSVDRNVYLLQTVVVVQSIPLHLCSFHHHYNLDQSKLHIRFWIFWNYLMFFLFAGNMMKVSQESMNSSERRHTLQSNLYFRPCRHFVLGYDCSCIFFVYFLSS